MPTPIEGALAESGASASAWMFLLASWLLTWLIFYGVARLKWRAASDLRREITALGERWLGPTSAQVP